MTERGNSSRWPFFDVHTARRGWYSYPKRPRWEHVRVTDESGRVDPGVYGRNSGFETWFPTGPGIIIDLHIGSLTLMDIVRHCLLAPVPCLAPAFAALRFIRSSVEQVQASKSQLEALVQLIAQLLQTIDGEYRAGRLLQVRTSVALTELSRFVRFTIPSILLCRSITQDYWMRYQFLCRRRYRVHF